MYTKVLDFLVNSGYIGIILAGFSEPLFLPFPMELVYLPIALANHSEAINYSFILIFCSFLGSCIAYIVGKYSGKKIEKIFGSSKSYFSRVEEFYNKNSFLAILTSSFTPIPFEVYTYSAGIFNVSFKKFAIASLLSRSIRYIPQSILILLYGEQVVFLIKKYGFSSALVISLIFIVIRRIYLKVRKTR